MTQREFFTAIVNGTINVDIQAYAADAIDKLDERNAKRKTKPTKAQEANEAVMVEIVAFLDGKADVLASEVGTGVGISTNKASALLTKLVERGEVTVCDIKVPKSGKRKAYSLAVSEE